MTRGLEVQDGKTGDLIRKAGDRTSGREACGVAVEVEKCDEVCIPC